MDQRLSILHTDVIQPPDFHKNQQDLPATRRSSMVTIPDLSRISAPMVNQSDLPFRSLTRAYGATLTCTQMLIPQKLLDDRDYLQFHLRDLMGSSSSDLGRPVVVQLCGNDPEVIVKAGREVQAHCDAIDLNLGCPQEHARAGHVGGYLLGRQDWPLVQDIVSAMASSFTVPVSAKLRLCQPSSMTPQLGARLEASGASWITLHARHVSARRRRQGAADLDAVKRLKTHLGIPVVSNGNVRACSDVESNRRYTGADGCMVGESLLGNPCLFAGVVPDPVRISLEYLAVCQRYEGVAPMQNVRMHVKRFVEFQCGRRPWYQKFRIAVDQCEGVDDLVTLLETKVRRWRGKADGSFDDQGTEG